MSLSGFIEALRHAADRDDESRKRMCSWTILTPHGQSEVASCGIKIGADRHLIHPSDFDMIVVVGPLLRQFSEISPDIYDFLGTTHCAGIPIAGLCTGSFVLAEAGLLDGFTACLHPYHALDFSERFPNLDYRTDRHFIEDKGIATVPGGTSVLNYAAHVIELHLGAARTSKVIHQMSLPGASWDIFGARPIKQKATSSNDARLKKAVSLMERTMETGGKVSGIATAIGVSERQLDRLFRKHFEISPKRYWLEMRLGYCRWLVINTDRSITDVAFVGGFSDSAHFITQFRKTYGVPPGAMRRSLQQE